MATKERVLALLSEGASYESAARELGIPAGQAYLVATGLPADGSDCMSPEDRRRPGIRFGSVQALVNPPSGRSSKPEVALHFLRARVASDAGLRGAAGGRDPSPPEPEVPDDGPDSFDVLEVLRRDHNQLNYLLKELQAVPAYSESHDEVHASRRETILALAVGRASAHETAEEGHFWPAVADWLGDRGEVTALRAREQEAEADELLAKMAALRGTDERFDEGVSELSDRLRRHVAFEDAVFLDVADAVPRDERVRVGRKVEAALRRA